ncbi:MAG: hypothetical protein IT490_01975, partial [Candidatus Contendobacter sp.]|nr:hypothetical protein [Candidatus Contendobacter sp.]
MKAQSIIVLILLGFSIAISHSAIAGDGFTQYFYGPTKIIKKGNPSLEMEDEGFDQHFYGEITNIDKKDEIVVDIKSITDWILIKEVKRRGLLMPV